MSCPTNGALTELLAATLPADDMTSLRDHLQQCPVCQNRLDQLTDSPALGRKPHSKAEIPVIGIDPLMDRLKRLNPKPPTKLPALEDDEDDFVGPGLWRPLALAALATAFFLAAAWWLDRYRLKLGHEQASARALAELIASRNSMDRLYRGVTASLDRNDQKTIELKRELLNELLLNYQMRFNETNTDRSLAAEASEAAFRLAVLSDFVGPAPAAITSYQIALQSLHNGPAELMTERTRICQERLADLFENTKQWGLAEVTLRQQIGYWQSQINDQSADLQPRRSLAALHCRIAAIGLRIERPTEAVGSYQSAIEVLEAGLKLSPDSPFVRNELAAIYQSLSEVWSKIGRTDEAEKALQKAKSLSDM